jgi:hypothetical protein
LSHNKVFNQQEVQRLKELINEGCQVSMEIESLNEGLNDTIKAIAEEMDISGAVLKKAIKVAHKASLDDEREKFDLLETILDSVGRNKV